SSMKLWIGVAVLGAVLLAGFANAAEWFPPRTRVWTSENGRLVPLSEPDFHFANAIRALRAGNCPAAATDVKRGAEALAYLANQPGHAGQRRAALKAQVDLDQLAAKLLRGDVGPDELDAHCSAALASLQRPRE